MSKAAEAGMPPPGGAPPQYPPASAPPPAYPTVAGPTGYPAAPPPQGYQAPPPQGYMAAQPPQAYAGAPPPGQPYPQAVQQYPQPPPGAATTVVVQPGPIIAPQAFRESPVTMVCPHCRASVTTSTHYESGAMVWIACASICGIGFLVAGITWFGCCLIPFCINSLKNVIHECPNCNREVGRYDRTR